MGSLLAHFRRVGSIEKNDGCVKEIAREVEVYSPWSCLQAAPSWNVLSVLGSELPSEVLARRMCMLACVQYLLCVEV